MLSYSYVAVDPHGSEMRGTLAVADQSEAVRRIKEMGLFPTKLVPAQERTRRAASKPKVRRPGWSGVLAGFDGIRPRTLSVFTRQLATLIEAGMPLLRGLRTLEEQEESRAMKRVIGQLSEAIEGGSSLTEAVAARPRAFNRLYVNMVKAGEIGGALEVTLRRLAEFMEKAARIKGKVQAALFYPCAVLVVAAGILTLMITFVVPRFRTVFEGLLHGEPMPALTRFVLALSETVSGHLVLAGASAGVSVLLLGLGLRTRLGRRCLDRVKLAAPWLGPVFRKAAISRFCRTLGTLVSSGVPILQALRIVEETAGNRVVGEVIARVHEQVKQGEPMAPTLKASGIFPLMVAGMVDVGEQTGALPEMLLKISSAYDDEVDDAVNGMTSLLEPIMIVVLAVIVGGIVIAMFLPLLMVMDRGFDDSSRPGGD